MTKRICDLQYEEFVPQYDDPYDDGLDFQDWIKDHLFVVSFLNGNIEETIAVPNKEMGQYIAGLVFEAGCTEIDFFNGVTGVSY